MKRFLAILVMVLGLSIFVNAQEHTKPLPTPPPAQPRPTKPTPRPASEPPEWVRYDSAIGRFSVLMPEIPKDTVETTQSDHGPYTTYLFIARDERNVYLIGWVDYDPKFNFNRQSEMEANRDNFVKGVKATLTGSRSLTIDGYQVLEFTADTNERTFKSRVYMVGRRPYQIVIGYPKEDATVAPVTKFFNSFKVSR
ncbi:MAG: hypothetical protein LC794_08750 [Acidobacteria bacterium]|nr:hypothetical protein [Acidobacteriota bacterium]